MKIAPKVLGATRCGFVFKMQFSGLKKDSFRNPVQTPRVLESCGEPDTGHRQKGFGLEPGPQSGFGHYQAQEVQTLASLKSTISFKFTI
jgi:hypothetical protein